MPGLSTVPRVTGVIALVATIAAGVGAAWGISLAWILFALNGWNAWPLSGFGDLAQLYGLLGLLTGSVIGSTWTWTVLRRVPLWRAVGEPTIAAMAAITALILIVPGVGSVAFCAVALAASGLAALRLAVAARRAPRIGGAAS